jgi:hypothetical protein
MVPLYSARIGDLGPNDLVRVQCISCGHCETIPPGGLIGLRLPLETLILDLEPRFRCRECDERGKAVATVAWA